jgi:hypothetical protein
MPLAWGRERGSTFKYVFLNKACRREKLFTQSPSAVVYQHPTNYKEEKYPTPIPSDFHRGKGNTQL